MYNAVSQSEDNQAGQQGEKLAIPGKKKVSFILSQCIQSLRNKPHWGNMHSRYVTESRVLKKQLGCFHSSTTWVWVIKLCQRGIGFKLDSKTPKLNTCHYPNGYFNPRCLGDHWKWPDKNQQELIRILSTTFYILTQMDRKGGVL